MKISPISHYAYLAGVLAIVGLTPLSAASLTVGNDGADNGLLLDQTVSNEETFDNSDPGNLVDLDAQIDTDGLDGLIAALHLGAVELSPTGPLTISSAINAARTVDSITTYGGALTLNPTGTLNIYEDIRNVASLTAGAGGAITVDRLAWVQTKGDQTWLNDVSLIKNGNLDNNSYWYVNAEGNLTFAGGISANPDDSLRVDLNADDALSVTGDVSGVRFDASADTISLGNVNALDVVLGATTNIDLNGDITAGHIVITGDVNLVGDRSITSTGSLSVTGDINGNDNNLTLSSLYGAAITARIAGVDALDVTAGQTSTISNGIDVKSFAFNESTANGSTALTLRGASHIENSATFNGGVTTFTTTPTFGASGTITLADAGVAGGADFVNDAFDRLTAGSTGGIILTDENTSVVNLTKEGVYLGGNGGTQLGQINPVSDTVRLGYGSGTLTVGKAAVDAIPAVGETPAVDAIPAVTNQITGSSNLVIGGKSDGVGFFSGNASVTIVSDQDYMGTTTVNAGAGLSVGEGAQISGTLALDIAENGKVGLVDGASFSNATSVTVADGGLFSISGSLFSSSDGVLDTSTAIILNGGSFEATSAQLVAALNSIGGIAASTDPAKVNTLLLGTGAGSTNSTLTGALDLSLVSDGKVFLGAGSVFGATIAQGASITAQDSTYRLGGVNNRSLTIAGTNVLSGGKGLLIDGDGSVRINAGQSYTGTTTINAGNLRMDHSSALGTGDVQINSGAQLSLGTSVVLSNNLTAGDGARLSSSSTGVEVSGNISQSAGHNLNLYSSRNTPLKLSGDNTGALGTFTIAEDDRIEFASVNSLAAGIKLVGTEQYDYTAVVGNGSVLAAATSRISVDSQGSLLLSGNSSTAIDMSAAASGNIWLGAFSPTAGATTAYSGALTAHSSTYRLGNNHNSVLKMTGLNQLSGSNTLEIGGFNSVVEIAEAQSFSGGTTLLNHGGNTLIVSKNGGLGGGNVTLNSGSTLKLSTADPFAAGAKKIVSGYEYGYNTIEIANATSLNNVSFSGQFGTLSLAAANAITDGPHDFNSDFNGGKFYAVAVNAANAINGGAEITVDQLDVNVSDGIVNSTVSAGTLNVNASNSITGSTVSASTLNLNATSSITGSSISANYLNLGATGVVNNTSFSGVSSVNITADNPLSGTGTISGSSMSISASGDRLNDLATDLRIQSTGGTGTVYVEAAPASGHLNIDSYAGDFRINGGGNSFSNITFASSADYQLGNLTLTGTNVLSSNRSLTTTGNVTLDASQSYTGTTTVGAYDTFEVNGTLQTSSLTMGYGSTLKGSGSINVAVTFGDGTTLAAGNSPGTLTLEEGATFEAGSVFALEVAGTADGEYDSILIGADLTFEAGSTIDITEYGGFEFADNTEYVFDLVDVITPLLPEETPTIAAMGLVFTNTDGSLIDFDTYEQSFDTSTGELTLTIGTPESAAVPEPSSAALLALGALAAVGRRKRKNA